MKKKDEKIKTHRLAVGDFVSAKDATITSIEAGAKILGDTLAHKIKSMNRIGVLAVITLEDVEGVSFRAIDFRAATAEEVHAYVMKLNTPCRRRADLTWALSRHKGILKS